jgi:acyl carrier protein
VDLRRRQRQPAIETHAHRGEPLMSSIEDCLKDILIEDLFVEVEKHRILPAHSLRLDLGIDSLGFVELREQVEKRFNIAVPDDEFTPENFSSISSLASLIARHCGASGMPQ